MSATTDFAFLHGGGNGGWVWDETIEAMTSQTDGGFGRALRLDVPGCGAKRDRPTDPTTIDDIAAELIADIEAAGLRDVVLVGHSQAGCLLPMMVELRPELFRRLVYISCSAPRNGQTVHAMLGTGLHGEHPDEVGWPVDPRSHTIAQRYPLMFCNDMSPAQTEDFLGLLGKDTWPMRSYAHTNWRYGHLDSVPASYVVCLRDAMLPVAWQERFAQRLRCASVLRIDAGHYAMLTRAHGLAEILRHEATR